MNKYIKDGDLKKYLDKQRKYAIKLRDKITVEDEDGTYAYHQGQIDQIDGIADEFDLNPLWV